jgi:hypothetical protein
MTTQSLKLFLAKCLKDKVECDEQFNRLHWKRPIGDGVVWPEIRETEMLHICWLVEQTLTTEQEEDYVEELSGLIMDGCYENEPRYHKSRLCSRDQVYRCSWQQRATALHKVLRKEEV